MLTAAENTHLHQVLDYWFNHLEPKQWFVPSTKLDQEITSRFLDIYRHLRDRNLPDLDLANEDLANEDLDGDQTLAAIILFDQMPRNMFRGEAQAFETDALAMSLCMSALANKFDLEMTDVKKSFIYMPLEHSENLNDQELCVSLFQQRTKLTEQRDYAVRHFNIINKFGRFPHRNKPLGRTSTPEEEAYLSAGGDSF